MALQAYVDDSASEGGDRRLFLACYINTESRWNRFSDAWKEELDASPAIKYLKMSEANSLSGEFSGWSVPDKDEKIRGLARVVRHFNPLSLHSSVSRVEYGSVIKPVAPHGFGHPYSICFQALMISLANYQAETGQGVPIDFVFDDQEALGEEARWLYEYIRETQPSPVRKLLSKSPVFRDDKLVYPLQAADMLAWHVRKRFEQDPNLFQVPAMLSTTGFHLASDIDAERLRSMARGFSKVPGVDKLKKKGPWHKIRKEIQRREQSGFVPPYKARRLKNTLLYARRRLARFSEFARTKNTRTASSLAAVFILCNSIAGLLGNVAIVKSLPTVLPIYAVAVPVILKVLGAALIIAGMQANRRLL